MLKCVLPHLSQIKKNVAPISNLPHETLVVLIYDQASSLFYMILFTLLYRVVFESVDATLPCDQFQMKELKSFCLFFNILFPL